MRDKKQVTIKVTEQFARDLNLVQATYGIENISKIVQGSVNAQAEAIRRDMAETFRLAMERADRLEDSL